MSPPPDWRGASFATTRFAVPRFAIASTDSDLRFRLKTSNTFGLMRTTPLWDVLRRMRHQPASTQT